MIPNLNRNPFFSHASFWNYRNRKLIRIVLTIDANIDKHKLNLNLNFFEYEIRMCNKCSKMANTSVIQFILFRGNANSLPVGFNIRDWCANEIVQDNLDEWPLRPSNVTNGELKRKNWGWRRNIFHFKRFKIFWLNAIELCAQLDLISSKLFLQRG